MCDVEEYESPGIHFFHINHYIVHINMQLKHFN